MPKESFALKLEIIVDEQSSYILDGQSRICNWLYNHLLTKGFELKESFLVSQDKESAKTLYSERGLRNLVPAIKQEHPFLKVVHSSVLKNAALRLSDSIQTHQKSKKGTRKKTGWPKYRSWKKKWFSLFYDEPTKGFKVEDKSLILSLGMGKDRKQRSISVELKEAHLLKEKTIRNLRITCDLGIYYAIFTLKKELPERKTISKVIAFDPNHKNLAYGVDTENTAIEIASPIWLKVYDKRIDELKRKRDHCQKKSKKIPILDEKGEPTGKHYFLSSKRWIRYDRTIKKALYKRREQTKTFMYTSANDLFKRYDCVAVGDYTPSGQGVNSAMRRAMNNRSLIGRWKDILSWVAIKSGKTFMEFDERGTTRTCHHCKYIEQQGIHVSLRIWECPACQAVHIRDENAAINGLEKVLRDLLVKYGRENLPTVSCSDLAFIQKRWAWSVLPSGVLKTLRGQNSNKMQLQEIKMRA